jgi:hypothetical protein
MALRKENAEGLLAPAQSLTMPAAGRVEFKGRARSITRVGDKFEEGVVPFSVVVPLQRPTPRTAPSRAMAPPRGEPELIAIIRRLYTSHLTIGHVLELETKRINSRRGTAAVEWRVPPGPRAMVSFLTATAASRAAQRRYGAKSFDDHCADDAEKIEAYSRRVTANEADAQLLIATVYQEAERLVAKRWDDIWHVVRALEKLGDEIGQEDLPLLLCCIKTEQQDILHRRGFVSSEHWLRRGLSKPRGYDPESREIDAVLSTGAAVKRRDYDGEFLEILDMGPKSVRLSRLNQGAAVLDSHAWDKGISAMRRYRARQRPGRQWRADRADQILSRQRAGAARSARHRRRNSISAFGWLQNPSHG